MIVCAYCGQQNPDGAINCQNCGAALAGISLQGLRANALLHGGRYQIQRQLAQGGFGITYVATHVALGQIVTIKELCPQGSLRLQSTLQPPTTQAGMWTQAVSSFVTEARTLAGFNHPGIVKVQDVFEENNTAYFVMELLQGQTLAERLQTRVLNEAQAVTLAQQICAALKVVHGQGMLHRDLKPDNVFLEPTRGAVLIDFGSARAFSGVTMHNTQILTPGYAPLEQYGTTGKFGPYTDIYSLAATLYTALTGYPPPDAVSRANNQTLSFPNYISSGWRDLIDRSMRFKVDERPQNIDEFLRALPNLAAAAVPVATGFVGVQPPMGNGAATIRVLTQPAPKAKAGFPMWLLAVPVLAAIGIYGYGQIPRSNTTTTPTSTTAPAKPSSGTWQASSISISTEALNVRSAPDLNSSIVQSGGTALRALRNEQLPVVETSNGWYKVQLQNSQGWVSARMSIPLEPSVGSDKVQQLQNDVNNNNTVQLEAGVYKLEDVLRLTRGVEIIGKGWQDTIILASSRTATVIFDSQGLLKLKNLTIAHTGAAPASALLVLRGAFELENVRLIGGADSNDPTGDDGDGMVVRGNAKGKIANSFFVGNRWRGLSLKDSAQVSLKNSVFRANMGSGIVANDNAQPEIGNNEIDGNGLMGIKIFNNASAIITANKIENNARGAFGFYDTAKGQVADNTCQGNGGTGVERDPNVQVQLGNNPGCQAKPLAPVVQAAPAFSGSSQNGIEYSAPTDRQQFLALNRDNNLWNMRSDRAKSVNFSADVGEVEHLATARAGKIYTWGMRWCGATAAIVQADLEQLELRLEADGVPIPASQTFRGTEATSGGGSQYCFRISTQIRGAVGASVRLSIVANFLTNTLQSDENRPFEPGVHTMTISVNFTGTASIPSPKTQLASTNSSITTLASNDIGRTIRFEYLFRVARADKTIAGRAYVI